MPPGSACTARGRSRQAGIRAATASITSARTAIGPACSWPEIADPRLGTSVVVDDEARDAVPPGSGGQRVDGEPAGVLQLLPVHHEISPGVAGHEADHELARKRPVLAPHIADVGDLDPDLLPHLPMHRALQALAVVDESRHQAV